MPELPEVETVRRELSDHIIDKKIVTVEIISPVIIKSSKAQFVKYLRGNCFEKIDRIGKLLKFHFKSGDLIMLTHLKMTGQLLVIENGQVTAGKMNLISTKNMKGETLIGNFRDNQAKQADKHLHVVINFEDGTQLQYRDVRKFGYMKLIPAIELESVHKRFGIEPLQENFSIEAFKDIFKGRKKSLKAILLDQQLIAGLGNIYVDEVCFQAGVRPMKLAHKLKVAELEKLHLACEEIITQAIEHKGTTFRDYSRPDGSKGSFINLLKVYARTGTDCTRCKTSTISKVKLGGRSTHYCKKCQK